jgi:hypothetical protein
MDKINLIPKMSHPVEFMPEVSWFSSEFILYQFRRISHSQVDVQRVPQVDFRLILGSILLYLIHFSNDTNVVLLSSVIHSD